MCVCVFVWCVLSVCDPNLYMPRPPSPTHPSPQPPPQFQYSRSGYIYYRTQVLQHIDKEYRILAEVIKNLQEYMDVVRAARNSEDRQTDTHTHHTLVFP